MQLVSQKLRIFAGAEFAEHHAAEELQKYLAQITGVTLPICTPDGTTENSILVGEAAPLTDADRAALKLDGFIIRTLPGNSLMLAGLKPISSLYAVYALLENYCGCGFFEDGDQVPVNPELAIGKIDLLDNPHFQYRSHVVNMTFNYSGMIWKDTAQTIQWLDSLAKKRINMLITDKFMLICSMTGEALEELGYDIHPTEYELERTQVLADVFGYAEKLGIRVSINACCYTGFAVDEQQTHAGVHLEEFIRQYNSQHTEPISNYQYDWCGCKLNYLDINHPEVARFYSAYLRLCKKRLNCSNFYMIKMPMEGSFSKDYSLEETGQLVIRNLRKEVSLIREIDSDALIVTEAPFPSNKTYPYQIEAIRGQNILVREYALNAQSRKYNYELTNYHEGMPWMGGTLSHCANSTNPNGAMQFSLSHVKKLASDPKAQNMIGFNVENEKHHRLVLLNDLFYAIAWNPKDIDLDDFLRNYTIRRYSSDALLPAIQDIADTLYSSLNPGLENCVQYRNFHSQYFSGLMADSAKISIGYLPTLHRALKLMLEHAKELENNDLFRFDVVDLGRTYLGFFFNLYFAGARQGGYFGNIDWVREYAPRALEVMDDIAKLCSAHEEFRLQTYYDWAERFSPMEPEIPDSCPRNVYRVFTNLLREENMYLVDYMAEDFAELIVHYYKPQIKLYFDEMDSLVSGGGKLSGRIMDHLLEADLPNRCNDFKPPQGKISWSGFGAVGEPELIKNEQELRRNLINGPIIRDSKLRYDGPISFILTELLEKYSITDEIELLLSRDPVTNTGDSEESKDSILLAKVGDVVSGITKGFVAESYDIDQCVRGIFECTLIAKEYNIARGNIERTRIRATDSVNFTRLEDVSAVDGNGMLKRFSFYPNDEEYILYLDEGSDSKPVSIIVKKA